MNVEWIKTGPESVFMEDLPNGALFVRLDEFESEHAKIWRKVDALGRCQTLSGENPFFSGWQKVVPVQIVSVAVKTKLLGDVGMSRK